MDQWRIQHAITFLVERAAESDLTKPMVVHAINVGEILKRWHVSEDVLIAGYLHDTIEDTRVSYEDIDGEFGVYVAQIIEANTITEQERRQENAVVAKYERVAEEGDGAVAVAAADLSDNMRNYKEYHPEEKWSHERKSLMHKKEQFLDVCKEFCEEEFYSTIKKYNI